MLSGTYLEAEEVKIVTKYSIQKKQLSNSVEHIDDFDQDIREREIVPVEFTKYDETVFRQLMFESD